MPRLYLPQQEVFDYDDVMLVPQTAIVKSRSEITVKADFGERAFELPIIPANMSTIVNEDTCVWLAERGYFYVMHRFDTDNVKFTRTMQEKGLFSSISVGIKKADYDLIDSFVAEKIIPEYITVDVAHGDSVEVIRICEYIKLKLPNTFLIAGNLASAEGALKLAEVGVDAVKVGVAPGFVCTTGPNTGFGSRGWQLSAIWNIAKTLKGSKVQIVADGGIRQYGDIAKSIAFGADMIMIGSMLAGHDENPGELLEINGEPKKAYFGSASEHQKGEHKHVEGRKTFVAYKGSLATTLQIIKENLQSSVSYSGGNKLHDLENVSYVIANNVPEGK